MREIIPGVFTWPFYSERFGYDFNGYFIRHADGNLVVDPVEMPADVLEWLFREGVARVVLTNRNHYRDAARLRERTNAKVMVHPDDAAFVREKGVIVDEALAAGDTVGPFTVIPVPGKSPGEVALSWPSRRLLLVGDACVGSAPGVLGLLPEKVMDDPAELRRSLRRVADTVDFDTLLVCDGHSIERGARSALRRLVEGFPS